MANRYGLVATIVVEAHDRETAMRAAEEISDSLNDHLIYTAAWTGQTYEATLEEQWDVLGVRVDATAVLLPDEVEV